MDYKKAYYELLAKVEEAIEMLITGEQNAESLLLSKAGQEREMEKQKTEEKTPHQQPLHLVRKK